MNPCHQDEVRLVWNFFKQKTNGVFVDVGANHPTILSQTWFLEQQGWSGVLVEPIPEMFKLLCEQRPRSRAVQAAVGAESGEADLLLGVIHQHSTLAPVLGDPLSGKKIRVPLRTLDSILAGAGVTTMDFLSIDVEGLELQVLQGLNLEKYAPGLILVEEHRHDYTKHNHLRRHGYRLVRRTGWNNWYVPHGSPVTVRTLNSPGEAFLMWRKMWLNPPFDKLKRKIKKHFHKHK
jgi:FkbM family methyltransferase